MFGVWLLDRLDRLGKCFVVLACTENITNDDEILDTEDISFHLADITIFYPQTYCCNSKYAI